MRAGIARANIVTLAISFIFTASVGHASDGETVSRRRPVAKEAASFRAETDVVLVPVTVLDRHGAPVSGLSSHDFVVTQDNAPQTIASFGEQDVPVSVSVVFDTSGSMQPVLKTARDALRAFVNEANPEDEAGMITVGSRPGQDPGFTSDLNSLPGRLIFSDAGGSTALVDTIYAAIHQSRAARNPRKALLIISDGMDNHSRYSKAELMSAATEADIQIYSIAVYAPPLTKKAIELAEERNGLSFLEELARRTGGVSLVARDSGDVNRAAANISRAMRDQYVIGYVPFGPATHTAAAREGLLPVPDGKWHSIKVTLRQSGVKAWARTGFYAN